MRLKTDFMVETRETKVQWHNIFKVLKEKNCQPRNLYPEKLSFKNEVQIKTLPNKQKLRGSVSGKPTF